MTEPARKLPLLDDASGFFWTSGADGHLRIQRCTDCGHYQHPPLPRCPQCHGEAVAPQIVSGRGRVATFTINRQAWLPGMAPFTFAAIELAEQAQLYVVSNVLGDPAAVHSGMAVRVCFELHDDVCLPLFRAEEAGA